MRKLLLISCLGCLIGVGASASTVTYTTTGSIFCNGVSGCSTITNGVSVTQNSATVTLVYDPNTGSTVSTPTNINYGAIDASASSSTAVDLTGLLLSLDVLQTVPTSSSGSFVNASVTGTLAGTSANANISWTTNEIFIGPETYEVFSPAVIVAPTSNSGVATLEGNVSDTVTTTPEPSAVLLAGAGLALLGLLRRRTV